MDGTVVQKVAAQKLSPKARSNTAGTKEGLERISGLPGSIPRGRIELGIALPRLRTLAAFRALPTPPAAVCSANTRLLGAVRVSPQ